MFGFIKHKFSRWVHENDAVAAVESALIFPLLLTMLLGTFDAGYGILAAQKTIRASQVTADLIARNRTVSDSDVDEAIDAGQLALVPFNSGSFGVDIQSVEFDENGAPVQLWCETRNMVSNANALNSLTALAVPGEGVVIVTVRYDFEPTFSGFLFDTIPMQEVSFVRGRLTSTVEHETAGAC
ncbi:pilus assembly protein [Alphaproteobacteria bacterium]|nr:pilus assembly protein [Alphaproteobacteria bacterium]